ncbi:Pestivirus Npro endopeptidase C53, putative [Trypanosoma equiperdum]|uniref:Protein Abitram n=2 Tax=Trypanozoon TaxID=39700 RepID=Q581S9_TRYB2|nr:hypothetical protein, conserved [Trypanosoma brucei brucei TREU927]AAX79891.1 hypothetical protein, conserved [Trypanosoma brucei]AAZ10743.1 hypothetical protein, conserved [Trypanosoma brucei brucei TREU927]SCU67823.1 Pestivirus Npro endopeptidase C53, putative [Trypanosoma equiperdum]
MNPVGVACAAAPKPSTFDYFTERYYHQYVVKNCKGVEGNNCRLLVHSNGICVLCLDETHRVVRAAKSSAGAVETNVASVVFGSGRGNSQLSSGSIHVVGKRKKQAAVCQVDTKICIITMSDGTVYHIPACVDGFVLELNSALQQHPNLLLDAPTAEGYIALISPNYSKVKFSEFTKLSAPTGGDVVEEEEEPEGLHK